MYKRRLFFGLPAAFSLLLIPLILLSAGRTNHAFSPSSLAAAADGSTAAKKDEHKNYRINEISKGQVVLRTK
jgi:hypothetical protein